MAAHVSWDFLACLFLGFGLLLITTLIGTVDVGLSVSQGEGLAGLLCEWITTGIQKRKWSWFTPYFWGHLPDDFISRKPVYPILLRSEYSQPHVKMKTVLKKKNDLTGLVRIHVSLRTMLQRWDVFVSCLPSVLFSIICSLKDIQSGEFLGRKAWPAL